MIKAADPERRRRLYSIAIRQAIDGFVYARRWENFPYDCWAVHAWESTMDWDPPYRCRPPDLRMRSFRGVRSVAEPTACSREGGSTDDPTGLARRLEHELGS